LCLCGRLLVVAVNRALDLAKQQAATETQKLLGGMMPPGGFGDLFK
jgi:DNA-binding protein YbaB